MNLLSPTQKEYTYYKWLPFKTVLAQFLLSTSVFSYVYFESVADTFLFYWINVCFDDFM